MARGAHARSLRQHDLPLPCWEEPACPAMASEALSSPTASSSSVLWRSGVPHVIQPIPDNSGSPIAFSFFRISHMFRHDDISVPRNEEKMGWRPDRLSCACTIQNLTPTRCYSLPDLRQYKVKNRPSTSVTGFYSSDWSRVSWDNIQKPCGLIPQIRNHPS